MKVPRVDTWVFLGVIVVGTLVTLLAQGSPYSTNTESSSRTAETTGLPTGTGGSSGITGATGRNGNLGQTSAPRGRTSALVQFPQNSSKARESEANRLLKQGDQNYRRGDLQAALLDYKESAALSDNSFVRLKIVSCLDSMGKVKEADTELDSVMRKRDRIGSYQSDPRTLVRHGEVLERNMQARQAEQVYRSIISTYKPSKGSILPALSIGEAKSLSDLKAYSLIIAAMRSSMHGDMKNALRLAKLATEAAPNLADTHLRYADMLDGLDQDTEALKEYRRCSMSKNGLISTYAIKQIDHIELSNKFARRSGATRF